MDEACRMTWGDTGHLVTAQYGNISDAGSWYCQRHASNNSGGSVTVDAGKGMSATAQWGSGSEILGGVQIQPWCDKYYPGTEARVTDEYQPMWNAFNWKCY